MFCGTVIILVYYNIGVYIYIYIYRFRYVYLMIMLPSDFWASGLRSFGARPCILAMLPDAVTGASRPLSHSRTLQLLLRGPFHALATLLDATTARSSRWATFCNVVNRDLINSVISILRWILGGLRRSFLIYVSIY